MNDGMIELSFEFLFSENKKIFPLYKAFFFGRRWVESSIGGLIGASESPVMGSAGDFVRVSYRRSGRESVMCFTGGRGSRSTPASMIAARRSSLRSLFGAPAGLRHPAAAQRHRDLLIQDQSLRAAVGAQVCSLRLSPLLEHLRHRRVGALQRLPPAG